MFICKQTFFALVITVCVPFLLTAQQADESARSLFHYPWLHKHLPVSELTTYEGEKTKLFEPESARLYVFNFWFSACPPCLNEISWLNRIEQEFKGKNIRFIAISFDDKETHSEIIRHHPFSFEQFYLDRNEIYTNQLVMGFPTTVITDEKGTVLYSKAGGAADEEGAKKIYFLLTEELKKYSNDK